MKNSAPFVGMVMAECAQVGLMILSKQAMATGMSSLVFVLYSNCLASLILLPCSLLHRSPRPPLSFSILSQLFLLGLFGCLAQVFGYAGINYSSPTLATAMLNLIPGFTFVLAIIYRMEIFDWKSSTTLAKSVGTFISILGAFIVTLFKGPPILMTYSPSNLDHQFLSASASNWVLGGFFLVIDCVMASSFTILQALILKKYPAELIVVFFYCFFVVIQSAAICLLVERDSRAWSLKLNTRLIAVIYSGVFGSAFQVGICTWCLHRTGPVFVSMFKPLGIIIAVVLGVLFLGDTFYLGSLIGALVIVAGFYSVVWGKAKELTKQEGGASSLTSTGQKVPLLQNDTEEI